MKNLVFKALMPVLLLISFSAVASDNIISVKSNYGVNKTAERLLEVLGEKKITIFVQVDHAGGAKNIGKDLKPNRLVVFGTPKIGTELMKCNPLVGLDLPQKALIWEDKEGNVWFSYNNPKYFVSRYALEGCGKKTIMKIAHVLKHFSAVATGNK